MRMISSFACNNRHFSYMHIKCVALIVYCIMSLHYFCSSCFVVFFVFFCFFFCFFINFSLRRASAAVHAEVVVLMLLFHCLLWLHFWWVLLAPCFVMQYCVLSSFAINFVKRKYQPYSDYMIKYDHSSCGPYL